MLNYNSADHYWVVQNDITHVFSSLQQNYVANDDATYLEWLSKGKTPTIIDEDGMFMLRIQMLEERQSPRRLREALTGNDGGWMQDIETKISTLRAQLTR